MICRFISIVYSLRKTLESIATPCSVNAKGKNLLPPRFDITKCDIKFSHSTIENSNIKSEGNRPVFLFTACFKLLFFTLYLFVRS